MTDPGVVAAITSGAVATAAIVGSLVTTGLTLRHQRKADDQRRRHERQMRLVDSGLEAAVEFFAAASRTSNAMQSADAAGRALSNAKSSGVDQQTYDNMRLKYEEARKQSSAAITDAENAYAAVRLLIPSATEQARRYLDLCLKADVHPDQQKDERQRARQQVEETIRRAFGDDLPANWMVADPVPGARWWQIRRRRAAKQAIPWASPD